MIHHYLKVAFRNMWKYKSQTLISVAGLAVGFACFAMATLWIRYESSYDRFHKNADRIYRINIPDPYSASGTISACPYPLAGYLQETFPEIEHSATIGGHIVFSVTYEETEYAAKCIAIDSSFFSMFDVKVIDGNMDFLVDNSKLAITVEKARLIFGNESPVGKEVSIRGKKHIISAVVTGWTGRSNYPFDFLSRQEPYPWGYTLVCDAFIALSSGIDVEAFRKKLDEHVVRKSREHIRNMNMIPITEIYYKDPFVARAIQFQHIVIFAIAGSLLILCTLFNYLTMFISRFRIRQKELALRMVYGASGRSLFTMLSVEFLISLIAALALGLVIIDIAGPYFRSVSEVKLELSEIYVESIVYIAAIIAIALAVFLLTLVMFRRRTLNASIRSNKKTFRKMSIAVQLTVSIVFAFCTLIILKQMYYLHNTDLGFAFKNRGSIYIKSMLAEFEKVKVLSDKIQQIPEIEMVISGYRPLLPAESNGYYASDWDGKPEDAGMMEMANVYISEQFVEYYELEVVEGEFLSDNDGEESLLINESAAKIFGWDKAVGKLLNGKRVKGVVKNIYNSLPTVAAKPFCYTRPRVFYNRFTGKNQSQDENPYILIKYNEGTWKICLDKIQKIIAEAYPDTVPAIYSAEEEYDKNLKSENALLVILTIVSLVCVIVCVFGFVSMIALTCEERRREIAIRKINGATIKDILDIFFKEHLTLLVIGAIIAFPVGYIAMKRWLEQYVVQTEMSAWIYLSILLALFMAIVLCVGGRVYKTSRENPIEAITN